MAVKLLAIGARFPDSKYRIVDGPCAPANSGWDDGEPVDKARIVGGEIFTTHHFNNRYRQGLEI